MEEGLICRFEVLQETGWDADLEREFIVDVRGER